MGDWGKIETPSGSMEVEDAKKIGSTIVHIGRILQGRIEPGQTAKVSIDEVVRRKVAVNHTATHLLQSALIKVLGAHVRQTGSLVDSGHLRFDFTHMKKLETREVARVEEIVNENIKASIRVEKKIESLDSARKEGATALFGEKYEDEVRVITIGSLSKELCGGTHADNTKDLEMFRIKSESSIASGVRRIEAVTGEAAKIWMDKQAESQNIKIKAEQEKENLKKASLEKLSKAALGIDAIIAKGRSFGGVKVIIDDLGDMDVGSLHVLSDKIKAIEILSVIILISRSEGRVSFIVSVTDGALKKGLNASVLAKELSASIGGSGGGRDLFAQGGGKDASKLDEALVSITDSIAKKLK